MTIQQQIRGEVLLQLYGAGQGISLGLPQIHRTAQRSGLLCTAQEIQQAALFLVGQGHAQKVLDQATGEQRFEITSAGVLHKENA